MTNMRYEQSAVAVIIPNLFVNINLKTPGKFNTILSRSREESIVLLRKKIVLLSKPRSTRDAAVLPM